MLLKSNEVQETKYKNTTASPIKILRQDKIAHIVQNTESEILAYSIFDQTAKLTDSWISSVNSPSMVMIKQLDTSRVQLVISDPDMRRGSSANTDGMSDAIFYDPGSTFNYQIVLKGLFSIDGTNPNFATTTGTNTTTINVTVKEGKSYSVVLRNLTTNMDSIFEYSNFRFFGTENKNVFNVESTDNQNFSINIYTAEGRFIKTISNVSSPYYLKMQNYENGVYVVSIYNSSSIYNQKVVIR
jgi:hypothetical protein